MIVQAWLTASLAIAGFAGKMPKLDRLLEAKRVRQSPSQMREMLTMIGLRPKRVEAHAHG